MVFVKRFVSLVWLISFMPVVFAGASNTDNERAWTGKLSIGFNLTSGNSDAIGTALGAECERVDARNELKLKVTGAYTETDNKPSQNRVRAETKYKRLFTHAYVFNENSVFHDGIAHIRHRIVISAGPGRYLLKNDRHKLSVDMGVGFVRHAPMGDRGDAEESVAIVPSQEFEWKFGAGAKFTEKCSVLIFADRFERVVVTVEAGLETPLNDWLSLNVKVANSYDNEPAEDAKSNDFILETYLACRF